MGKPRSALCVTVYNPTFVDEKREPVFVRAGWGEDGEHLVGSHVRAGLTARVCVFIIHSLRTTFSL